MFLRIAVMDAKLLQKIVDMVQRPELRSDDDHPDSDSTPVHTGAAGEPTTVPAPGTIEGMEGTAVLKAKKSVRINDRPLPAPRVDVRRCCYFSVQDYLF